MADDSRGSGVTGEPATGHGTEADRDQPREPWPPADAVLVLRALRWGIFGAAAGAAAAVTLVLTHRVPAQTAGVFVTDFPIGFGAAAAALRLWVHLCRWPR